MREQVISNLTQNSSDTSSSGQNINVQPDNQACILLSDFALNAIDYSFYESDKFSTLVFAGSNHLDNYNPEDRLTRSEEQIAEFLFGESRYFTNFEVAITQKRDLIDNVFDLRYPLILEKRFSDADVRIYDGKLYVILLNDQGFPTPVEYSQASFIVHKICSYTVPGKEMHLKKMESLDIHINEKLIISFLREI